MIYTFTKTGITISLVVGSNPALKFTNPITSSGVISDHVHLTIGQRVYNLFSTDTISIDGIIFSGSLSALNTALTTYFTASAYTSGVATGYSRIISSTTVIPFDYPLTIIPELTLSSNPNFTVNTTGALAGNGAIVRIIGDGSHTPTFTGFKQANSSKSFDNSNNTPNDIIFWYDGVDFIFSIFQIPAPTPVTPSAPTSGVVDDTADTFNWTNNPLFTSLSDMEQTLDGDTTVTALTAKPIVVGNIAKAPGQVGVRVKAVGGNPASAWLFNASAFNVIVGATLKDLTFTENYFLLNTGGVWTADMPVQNAAWDNRGVDALELIANGNYIECEHQDDCDNYVFGIVKVYDKLIAGYPHMVAGLQTKSDGSILKVEDGVFSSTGGTIVAGEFARLSYVGGVLKIQKRSGSTITDIVTITTVEDLAAIDKFPALDIYGSGLGKMRNPKIFN